MTKLEAKEVGMRLELLRTRLGYESQVEFARASGVDPTAYNHIKCGRRKLSLRVANQLRERWGVTLEWLFHGRSETLTVQLAKILGEKS